TLGILVSSLAAERLAKRYEQRTLIMAGFVVTIARVTPLLALGSRSSRGWGFVPRLLLIGVGGGVLLAPSADVVQSAFPESQQGEISGLSRSVSNLGSSLGTAIAGTILVSGLTTHAYGAAMIVLGAIGLVGLVAAVFLPATRPQTVEAGRQQIRARPLRHRPPSSMTPQSASRSSQNGAPASGLFRSRVMRPVSCCMFPPSSTMSRLAGG